MTTTVSDGAITDSTNQGVDVAAGVPAKESTEERAIVVGTIRFGPRQAAKFLLST